MESRRDPQSDNASCRTLPTASGETAALKSALAETAHRLHQTEKQMAALLQRLRRRWQHWNQQWEKLLKERNAWQEKYRQLKADHQQWQQQRKQAEEAIRAEQNRLIEAWNKLEQEQRQILAGTLSSVPQSTPARRTLQDNAIPVERTEPAMETSAPLWAAETVFMPSLAVSPPSAAAYDPEAARQQFERLKHDIRNHAQRLRRSSDDSHLL